MLFAMPYLIAEQRAFFLTELRAIREEIRKLLPLLLLLLYKHSTPPTPQEAQKEEANNKANTKITTEKHEQQPLYQATVEDDTEHGNSILNSKSTLSSFPYLCTAPASRDPAVYLSKALFASSLTSLFSSASRFGYIECMEGMEATGEGWMVHCSRKAIRVASTLMQLHEEETE